MICTADYTDYFFIDVESGILLQVKFCPLTEFWNFWEILKIYPKTIQFLPLRWEKVVLKTS